MPTYKEQQILDKVCKVMRQKQIKYYDFIPLFDFQYEKIIFNCSHPTSHLAPQSLGYPDWAIKRVKEQMNRKKAIRKDKSKKDKAQEKSRGVVTVPYVHSEKKIEKIQRIFIKHRLATVVKPQTTLRQVLAHRKDKVDKQK